jgi:ATP-dependent RNA helicase DHX8/PRP22
MSVLTNRTVEWVVYHEVIQTTKVYMREVSVIQPSWLYEVAPNFYEYNPKSKKQEQQLKQEMTMTKPTTTISGRDSEGKIHRSVF